MDDQTRLQFARLHLLDAAHLVLDLQRPHPLLAGVGAALEALAAKLLSAIRWERP